MLRLLLWCVISHRHLAAAEEADTHIEDYNYDEEDLKPSADEDEEDIIKPTSSNDEDEAENGDKDDKGDYEDGDDNGDKDDNSNDDDDDDGDDDSDDKDDNGDDDDDNELDYGAGESLYGGEYESDDEDYDDEDYDDGSGSKPTMPAELFEGEDSESESMEYVLKESFSDEDEYGNL